MTREQMLEIALKRLVHEVNGCLGIAEQEMRDAGGHTNVNVLILRRDEAVAALQPETPAPSSAWYQHQVLPTLESEKCRNRDGGYCSNWAEYSNGKTLRCALHIPDPQVMRDEQWIMLPKRYEGPRAPQETP